MAVLGSIFFKRTLKQFLDCDDLESDKGRALTEKLRESSADSLEYLLETIPHVAGEHRATLTDICLEHVDGNTEELFLKELDNDATEIRRSTAEILSKSTQVSPAKLFKKLHESETSRSEVIEILEFHAPNLKPEQIINNALKLRKGDAEQLLKLAYKSEQPLAVGGLHVEPASIESPSLKIAVLRYFAKVQQPDVAQLIARFLGDDNKTVVIEALKALKDLKVDYDVAALVPFVEGMSDVSRELVIEIIHDRANEENAPKLAPLTCGKSDEAREQFTRLFIKFATTEGLENYLKMLDVQDWWGKERSLKALQQFGDEKLFTAARGLTEHKIEFVREQAQNLAAQATSADDQKMLWSNALHENWQVRENAIDTIGKSGKRESMAILKKVIDERPDSATAVLKAIANLGFTKGLEISFACLRMPEALIQRQALESIGELTTERHAKTVRDKLMQMVPSLQATVRDTAGEVISRMTREFKLPELEVDQETYFDTRLTKVTDASASETGTAQATAVPPAGAITDIEDFKQGDQWLGRYRIDREIGRGAMGRVMLATDEMVGEPLILKFMHPELTAEEGSRERFLREVRYSRKVSHPNVIRVHDMLSEGDLSAISMEYFESRGIDEFLKEEKFFDEEKGLGILLQVANGMAAAHDQEVIHRDLKPSNILMDDKGLVKIVDFGIASASSSQADAELTKVGSIIGTPAYLSPERAKGMEADHRSDIYALGIIAYCMFTGKLPYVGEPMSLLYQHLEGKATPVHEVRSEVDPRVSKLVQELMAVNHDDRPQTMYDVADAIRKVQQELGLSTR